MQKHKLVEVAASVSVKGDSGEEWTMTVVGVTLDIAIEYFSK